MPYRVFSFSERNLLVAWINSSTPTQQGDKMSLSVFFRTGYEIQQPCYKVSLHKNIPLDPQTMKNKGFKPPIYGL